MVANSDKSANELIYSAGSLLNHSAGNSDELVMDQGRRLFFQSKLDNQMTC